MASKKIAKRDKADQAFDRKMGIKQGSAKDKAIDKAVGVAKYEYGGGKGKKGYKK